MLVAAAVRGSQYVELPYTVKGMDVSFSGILSYIEVRGTNNLLIRLQVFRFDVYNYIIVLIHDPNSCFLFSSIGRFS